VPAATWVKVSTGREIIARDLSGQQLGAWVFSGFGLTALLLGVGSLFGLVAYVAESKKREFGVRLALGATASNLIRHGMTTALLPVASGAAAGLLLAAFLTRLLASRLAGLNPLDPFTYAAVAVTVMVRATVAALIAAWRVRRLVPTDVLRAQ